MKLRTICESPKDIRSQVHKRMTMNALIQGNAVNAYLEAHYLAKDELDELDPKLVPLYNIFTHGSVGQYHGGELSRMFDQNGNFWTDFQNKQHALANHPFLGKHGNKLYQDAKAYHQQTQKSMHTLFNVYSKIQEIEAKNEAALENIAMKVANMITSFPIDRMEAELTHILHVTDNISNSQIGRMLQQGKIGTSRVEHRHNTFYIEAKATIFPVLVQELVKGATEVLSLWGLTNLDDDEYERVTKEADILDDEPWMIQVGPQLWREFLKIKPKNIPLHELITKLAKLPPEAVHNLLEQIVTNPEWATELLTRIK